MALHNEDTIAHDVCSKLELFRNKDMYGLFKARLNNKFFNSELSDSLRELRDLSEQVIIPAKLEEFNKKNIQRWLRLLEKTFLWRLMELIKMTSKRIKIVRRCKHI